MQASGDIMPDECHLLCLVTPLGRSNSYKRLGYCKKYLKRNIFVTNHQYENSILVIKQQIYMYKTSVYTLVNGNI